MSFCYFRAVSDADFIFMLNEQYDYPLPTEKIALHPVNPPDHCKLLWVSAQEQSLIDRHFYDLPDILHSEDLLIVNESKVEARRVYILKKGSDYRFESVFIADATVEFDEMKPGTYWQVLIRKSRKLKSGDLLYAELDANVQFTFYRDEHSNTFLKASQPLNEAIFMQIGQMPIPPYFQREAETSDRTDYQNFFGQIPGSAAASTASLHFTERLTKELIEKKISIERILLHISYGTFAPLTEENFSTGELHAEYYEMPESLAQRLIKRDFHRVIAVGTTSMRVLESVARISNGKYNRGLTGQTKLFLKPGDSIQVTDGLITNFHMPASSLMLLVGAMLGEKLTMQAYHHALAQHYRFLSYGDAMFIELPPRNF
ncbi:MAG: tRNA preQ1(34) S-adenosylmethionine ribosyltransferase-isomerase QueA [Leptospiraceae bacterium]|nr:tRNA preQ1(34) S-adenosylmethionine ribosyltransferase-isomerase QueA [Leptospiraceae bacterium]